VGVGCTLAGAGVAAVSGLQHLRAAVLRHQARLAWQAAPALPAALAPRDTAGIRLVGATPRRRPTGAAVARLEIPRIALDEVVVEGVGKRELSAGPGHLPGSVLPGEEGNSIISAHRDRHFHRLDRVAIGDTVWTETNERRVAWRVVARRVVDRESRPLAATPTATLTLTTCWPVRYLGPAPDRLILTAVPLGRGEVAVAPRVTERAAR
jgi:sortase A